MVLVLMTLAAGVFSYLGAFAVTGTLAAADVIDKWPPHNDPRPRWMAVSFATLLASFLVIATLFRWTSSRQLRRLDALAQEDE